MPGARISCLASRWNMACRSPTHASAGMRRRACCGNWHRRFARAGSSSPIRRERPGAPFPGAGRAGGNGTEAGHRAGCDGPAGPPSAASAASPRTRPQVARHVDLLRYRRSVARQRRRRAAAPARWPQMAADGEGPGCERCGRRHDGAQRVRMARRGRTPRSVALRHDSVSARAGQGRTARPGAAIHHRRHAHDHPAHVRRQYDGRRCASTRAKCTPTWTASALHAPINEIELELEAGDPTRLLRTRVRARGAMFPLALEPLSKAARGYMLRHPAVPAPVHAEDRRACVARQVPRKASPRSFASA